MHPGIPRLVSLRSTDDRSQCGRIEHPCPADISPQHVRRAMPAHARDIDLATFAAAAAVMKPARRLCAAKFPLIPRASDRTLQDERDTRRVADGRP